MLNSCNSKLCMFLMSCFTFYVSCIVRLEKDKVSTIDIAKGSTSAIVTPHLGLQRSGSRQGATVGDKSGQGRGGDTLPVPTPSSDKYLENVSDFTPPQSNWRFLTRL